MKLLKIYFLLLALLVALRAFGQASGAHEGGCDELKKQAVRLSTKEALILTVHKDIPRQNKMYQGAKIEWTVLVNQDGVIQCVLDNSPAETWGRLDLMLSSMKALANWKFKPFVSGGQPRPFIAKLSFLNSGESVSVE